MNMACSSVLKGGGTNQELVLHCLHECGGDFLVSTRRQHIETLSWTCLDKRIKMNIII